MLHYYDKDILTVHSIFTVQCTLSAFELTEYGNNALVLEQDKATTFKNGKKLQFKHF